MKAYKWIRTVVICTLFVNADWTTLKPLPSYAPKEFSLKKGVELIELRSYHEEYYHEEKNNKAHKSMKVVLQVYRKPLSTYGAKTKRKFTRLKSSRKKNLVIKSGGWGGLMGHSNWVVNGFMLDSQKKMWLLEGKHDVIDMIRPISTPAEIRLIMWLNDYGKGDVKYKRNKKGFTVIEHYVVNAILNGAGTCGDFTYRYRINHSGRITQRKLIRKRAVRRCDHIMAD